MCPPMGTEEVMRTKRLRSKLSQMMRKSHICGEWGVGSGHGHILQHTKIHTCNGVYLKDKGPSIYLKILVFHYPNPALQRNQKRKKDRNSDKRHKAILSQKPSLNSCNQQDQNHQPRRHIKSHLFYFSKETELDHPHAR